MLIHVAWTYETELVEVAFDRLNRRSSRAVRYSKIYNINRPPSMS